MFDDTPLVIARDEDTFAQVVEALASAPIIGVDTESDSFHHYQEKVCLLQFSDADTDYIVDPLSIDDISALGPVMDDPGIVKIFHGVDYDVMCMNRDFGFTFRNLFDTMIGAQMLGYDKVGLADLIHQHFGWTIDKQFQRHDWAKRPLLPEHLDYARGDTHFLVAIREIMIRELRRVGRLGHVDEECRLLEDRRFEPKPVDPNPWLRTKGTKGLDDAAMRVIKFVWEFRDEQARRQDRPTFKVLSDSILVTLARRKPTSLAELDKVFPRKSNMKRRYGQGMVEAVRKGLEADFDIPEPAKPKRKKASGPKARLTGRTAEKAFLALKEWRNDLVDHHDHLTPITVASNSTLKSIVRYYPRTLDMLRSVPDVRNWQVKDFGEQILDVLGDAVPADAGVEPDDDDGKPKKRRRRRRRSGGSKPSAEA